MLESFFDPPLVVAGLAIVAALCLFALIGLAVGRRRVLPRLGVRPEDSEFIGSMLQSVLVFYGLAVAHIAVSVWQTSSEVSQSQRDCVLQPRVATKELPWVGRESGFNPNGVASSSPAHVTTPLGLFIFGPVSQGSSFLATLGFVPESLRDSTLKFPESNNARDSHRKRSQKTAPGNSSS